MEQPAYTKVKVNNEIEFCEVKNMEMKDKVENDAFLASPDAGYMTGCTLTMDGGATLPVVAANDFV